MLETRERIPQSQIRRYHYFTGGYNEEGKTYDGLDPKTEDERDDAE